MEIKLKKIHKWTEFLTRVKLNKFVGKCVFKLYDGLQVIYVERSENNLFLYLFQRQCFENLFNG